MSRHATLGLVASRFLSTLGFQLLVVGSFYTTYQSTGSPFQSGLLGLALYIPTIVLSIFGGVYADKQSRIGRHYVLAQATQLLPSILLLYCGDNFWMTFGSLAILSGLRSLRSPLYYSLMGTLQSRVESTRDSGGLAKLNTLSWQIPLVLAPALLGYFVKDSSFTKTTLLIALGVQIFSLLLSLRLLGLRRSRAISTQSPLAYFRELSKNKFLVLPLYADAVLASVLGLSVFLPFYIDSLNIHSSNFGYLKSLFHLMALAMTLFMPLKLLQKFKSHDFATILILWGLVVLSLSLVDGLVGLSLGIASLGLIDGLSSLFRENLIFTSVPPEQMGKVSAVNSFLISTGDELGDFNVGWLLSHLGEAAYFFIHFSTALILSFSMKHFLGARQDYKTQKIIKENI